LSADALYYFRRVTPEDKLGPGKEKLQQKVIDFEKLNEAGLKDGNWDVVFITYVPPSPRATVSNLEVICSDLGLRRPQQGVMLLSKKSTKSKLAGIFSISRF
jgi:hypothetical protein